MRTFKNLQYDDEAALGFIYLCPKTVLAHWIYLVSVGALLAIAYVLFKMKYYHLHKEYLTSLKK